VCDCLSRVDHADNKLTLNTSERVTYVTFPFPMAYRMEGASE